MAINTLNFLSVWGSGNQQQLKLFLNNLSITDVAILINNNQAQEADILNEINIHRAASTFKILDVNTQKRIISELPPYKTAELLNQLSADDRTAFLEYLPDKVINELIKTLNPEERKITLSLLGYPIDSVGRLMTPNYIAVKQHWTVLQVLKYIRRVGKQSETIDVIYVVNDQLELVDDLRIKEFLIVAIDTTVSQLMDNRFLALNVNDHQSVAAYAFKNNNRVALPVVNNKNILLGIVTIDDILWVAEEEYSEDMQKIGGTEALNEPYLEMPFWKLISKRATWLIVLFLGELLTASAMSFFEDEIKKVIVLNMLVPLIISSGGNSGSQAATLVIQAMAKGEVAISDAWQIFNRELKSGLVLGGLLGIVGFLRTYMWSFIEPNLYGTHTFLLALVTCFSVLGVVLWGTIMGAMLPLGLKRLKLDPATSSAPFVATLVDVVGIIIYFSVAYIFLKGTLL